MPYSYNELAKQLQSAIAALQIAAGEIAGPDAKAQLAKIAEWLGEAETTTHSEEPRDRLQ